MHGPTAASIREGSAPETCCSARTPRPAMLARAPRLHRWAGRATAALLLLAPRTVVLGAILTLGTISGAIFAHLTKLGLTIPAVDDHGELFGLAIAILVCTVVVLYLHRSQIPFLGPRLFSYSN